MTDSRAHVTTFMVIPKEHLGKGMYDNNFIRYGSHPTQHIRPEEMEIIMKPDEVIWNIQKRSHIKHPPINISKTYNTRRI